ncbi:hypothetical protein D9M68_137990 [compost metagenome]
MTEGPIVARALTRSAVIRKPLLAVGSAGATPGCTRWRRLVAALELTLQQGDLLGQGIALTPQFARLFHDTGELFFMPFGQPAVFGSVGAEPLPVSHKLLVTLAGLRKGSFRATLGFARFLGLQHDELLHAFEPGGSLVDLHPQGGLVFGAGGPQCFQFAGMGVLRFAQGLLCLRATGVARSRSGFGLPDGSLQFGLASGVSGQCGSEPRLQVVNLGAKRLHFRLQPCVGGLQRFGARGGGGRFGLKLPATLREDLFPLFDGQRPDRQHRVGDCWRQCRGERVVARLLVLPQLQLVVDGGAAALANLGVDGVMPG